MVVDALLAPILAAVKLVLAQLPVSPAPSIPSLAPLWSTLGGVDSLVPIAGPLTFMVGLLSLVVVFIAVRLVLTLWNLIWP